MKRVIYVGEQKDIGRFGTLKKGDEVTLSQHEYDAVADNGQWLDADSDEAKKVKSAKLTLPPEVEAEIKHRAAQLGKEDEKRLAEMTVADRTVERRELIAKRENELRTAALARLEESRRAALEKENDPSRVLGENLGSMNREELLRTAKAMREEGKNITVNDADSAKALRRAIKGVLGLELNEDDQGD